MRKDKAVKVKSKVFEKHLVLVLIATLFMSVAFANITDIKMEITGTLTAPVQSGVFISNITQSDQTGVSFSSINYYRKTAISTTVQLSSLASSYIKYKISLYNNSGTDYYFTGVSYDSYAWDNNKFIYELEGIEENSTIIAARTYKTFYITFKYGSSVSSSQTLNSIVNFDFSDDFIDFSVDGTSYTVPNGMTWEQFVNSELNTDGFIISNDKVYSSDGKVIILSKSAVNPKDTITSGNEYFYEMIEITLSRVSSSSITQGTIAKYTMTVETNGTIKTRNVFADVVDAWDNPVEGADVTGSGTSYTITVDTAYLSAGTYKIRIREGAFVTTNDTSSSELISSQTFKVVQSSSGGNTIGNTVTGGNTITGGNTYY